MAARSLDRQPRHHHRPLRCRRRPPILPIFSRYQRGAQEKKESKHGMTARRTWVLIGDSRSILKNFSTRLAVLKLYLGDVDVKGTGTF